MNEATGLEAKTIHRLLEIDPKTGGFRKNNENPLDCDLLVIDETSMVDVLLMHALLKAVPDKAALLVIGMSTNCLRLVRAKSWSIQSLPALYR